MKGRTSLLSYLAFLLVFSSMVGAQQEPSAAQTAKKIRWTEDDRKELLTKARGGDANSQMWLATAYEQGWFGKRNYSEALKWFRKSAAKGNPDAQNSLGQMYEDGEGAKQSYILAAKWYRRAAEHVPDLGGAGQGRNNLGLLYLEGRGVQKDYVQAYVWFKLFGGEPNRNLALVRDQMTQKQILEGERRVEEWKTRHHDQQD
jgi:TPR repeat protein